jgi:hypothetical protein
MMTVKPKQRRTHKRKPLSSPTVADDYGRLLPVAHVSEILMCSRQKVYQLGKSKQLHMVKFGAATRITDASLRKFLAGLPLAEIKGQY